MDKLVFIHKNTQVLERCCQDWSSVPEKDLVEMEDDLVTAFSIASSYSMSGQ
jgi:hypothetical protein